MVADNNMFIMAVKTMGLLSKFKIKTTKSETEIYIE